MPASLDELFCEYVDGTMDPAVREVFEEFLQANPSMAHRAERLQRARHLLCQHRCQVHAPCGMKARVQRRLASQILQDRAPVSHRVTHRLGKVVAGVSATVVLVLLGMVAGTLLSSEMHRTATGHASLDLGATLTPVQGQHAPMTPMAGMDIPFQVFGRTSPLFAPSVAQGAVPEVLLVADTVHAAPVQRTHAAP